MERSALGERGRGSTTTSDPRGFGSEEIRSVSGIASHSVSVNRALRVLMSDPAGLIAVT